MMRGDAGGVFSRSGRDAAAPAIPTGKVTFLFSDIEGSTLRWDANRAAMAAAVERHDAVVRRAVAACGGHIFKTLGDGFCCAFTHPQDAVAAALELQCALAREDFSAVDGLSVRVALHTGTADERDGDYFGPAVNRAARLLATAHAKQVIVSSITHDAAVPLVVTWATFKDLGEHRLKDLAQPMRVYQLVARDLRVDFPPLRSLSSVPNNLPANVASFFGREREVAEIAQLVARERLVTLVGSGGVGKTRLSLHVAASVVEAYGDGVWFIELAPLQNGEYLPATVAQVLGVTLPPSGDPLENLTLALKTKRALLIFDNCEHLVEAAARVIAALLRECSKLRILASTRQALAITGEVTYRLPSLGVPEELPATALSAHGGLQWPVIALFVDRAQAVDSRFALTDDNAAVVADICRRLDGIPLAIELAAARVKILSPRQLRERLDERFRVLTGGKRDVLPRQQTLRALIDWSYDLLDEGERRLFRQLGIFARDFALDGALAVGRGDAWEQVDSFDAIASLVDKSLVLAEPGEGETRYRLLESTRAYACEKLDAHGERAACENRHLRYLRDRFAEANERYRSTLRPADIDGLLVLELDDVRAALDTALRGSDVLLGGEVLALFGRAWGATGLYREGLARILAFLAALPPGEVDLRARLATNGVLCAMESGQERCAFELGLRAVADARASRNCHILAVGLIRYGLVLVRLSRFGEAEAALQEAEEQPALHAGTRLLLLAVRAHLKTRLGEYSTAASVYEDLRATYRSLGNVDGEIAQTINLAEAEQRGGRLRRAIAILNDILPLARSRTNRILLVQALINLASLFAALDDWQASCATVREAIAQYVREPDAAYATAAIEQLALGLALGGDVERAAIYAGYADTALREHGLNRQLAEAGTYDRLTALLRERFAPHELSRLLARGAALTPEAAVSSALSGA